MTITFTGTITDIFPSQIIGNFEKRVFWIVEPDTERYPNHFQVECHQGDANILDNFRSGDVVTVKVDLRGKKGKLRNGEVAVFNTMKCWSITKVGAAQPAPSTRQQTGGIPPQSAQGPQAGGSGMPAGLGPEDDLPF